MNVAMVLRRIARLPRFWLAVAMLSFTGSMAAFPEVIVAPSPGAHDPLECSLRAPDGGYQDRLPPSSAHWFGTDAQGCDYFARVVHGARSSMVVGLSAAALMTIIGTAFGLLAAIRGGWFDSTVRHVADVVLGMPLVLGAILLLSLMAGDARSVSELAVVLAALSWPITARLERSAARQVLVLPYVEAARAAGATTRRIATGHVLRNTLPSVLVYASVATGTLIGAEATLTYLGIGLQLPAVSWGLMIGDAQRSYEAAPHLLVIPAAFLTAAVLGFLLLGDALRDAIDPDLVHR